MGYTKKVFDLFSREFAEILCTVKTEIYPENIHYPNHIILYNLSNVN